MTALAPSCCAGFVRLQELAEKIGMRWERLATFFPMHWRNGVDMVATDDGVAIRLASLPDLVGELAVSGESGAALNLMRFCTPPTNHPAGCGGTDGFADLGSAARTTDAPARETAPTVSWAKRWEETHE